MQRIDSHHHFWIYEAADYDWIDETMGILRHDFLCGELKDATKNCGVDGVVSVQARTSAEETDFLLAQGERCPLVKAIVGWAPLKDPALDASLERWQGHPLFKGVREICQGSPDAEFFDCHEFNLGITALTSRGIPYDLLLYENQLPTVIRFVDRHPEQQFIVDHIAKPVIKAEIFAGAWAQNLKELAKRENVVACKFSGVVTEVRDPDWNVNLLRPYFHSALDAFSSQRLMFGSDWPVCLLRATYENWIATVSELTGELTLDEAEAFWSGNAKAAYGLE